MVHILYTLSLLSPFEGGRGKGYSYWTSLSCEIVECFIRVALAALVASLWLFPRSGGRHLSSWICSIESASICDRLISVVEAPPSATDTRLNWLMLSEVFPLVGPNVPPEGLRYELVLGFWR